MTPAEFPVRRPVATAMIFAALVLLGAIAWRIIPVELFPDIEGDRLSVAFTRPGSEPEVVERELLRALEARVETLSGVAETWGTVTGDSGRLRIRFEPGTDLHVRDLDLRRIAADLERTQPRGTRIEVQSFDTEIVSRFVMVVQITGAGDRFALRDLAEEEIRPRLASVPGVSAAMLFGGAPRELRIAIDPQRIAALGIDAASVAERVTAALARPRFAGTAASGAGRAAVLVDGRPEGEVSLARLTLVPGRNVQLRHVADVALTAGEEEERARVDGRPAVTLVLFKQAEANLVRVGRALRERLHELEREFAASGLRFTIAFDGARTVEEQLRRLEKLAAGGFAIALAVLLLFLRQLRPVAVVAVSVPASLLIGVALLYLSGQSVNLITLFGLAVGIGMLVDNSIVVYEAVQRRLERGDGPDEAAVRGVGTTARAILAATATNAVVFVPLAFTVFESGLVRRLLEVLALAYLIPLAASLLVALGLVPLLARYLAAPAALARLAAERARRRAHGGLPVPSRAREVFSALLAVALRRPGAWLAATGLLVVASALVGAVWLGASAGGAEPARADEVRLQVDLPPGLSLDGATERVAVLEEAALAIGGVERVTSLVREEDASLTIRLEPEERRPPGTDAALVRERLQRAAREMTGVEIRSVGSGGGGGEEDEGLQELLGQAAPEVVISGPDADRLAELARQIEAALEELPEVASAWPRARPGREEVWVEPEQRALASLGLTAGEVLPVLALLRREGFELQVGYQERAGREIPVVFRRPGRVDREAVTRLPVVTPAGVRRLGTLARLRRAGSPTAIQHHNGRLEIAVRYRLSPQAPRTGPERAALDRRLREAVASVRRPPGYAIEPPAPERSRRWFREVILPVVLLLYGVLAVTFESLVLPLLVLTALPLTVVGAVVALLVAGLPADTMALVGALALLGLTVNPAILLIDRMQRRALGGRWGAGAAALAAVRERTRPVLMTSATTIAGLWPLALATGRENEIWPPFATVVMGGLATSTLLTLLVIPVGFVLLRRLDELFGRLGPWIVIAWAVATAVVVVPLAWSGLVASLTWRAITTALVAAGWLGLAVLLAPKPPPPEPRLERNGPPRLEVRFLHKTYGGPGPVARAWAAPEEFARRVLARGGRPFHPGDARAALVGLALAAAGALYLAFSLGTGFWRLVAGFAAAGLAARGLMEFRRARGRADDLGRPLPGGPEAVLAACAPWIVFEVAVERWWVVPALDGTASPGSGEFVRRAVLLSVVGAVVLVVQLGRRTAVRLARQEIDADPRSGRALRLRRAWRSLARRLFGLGLTYRPVVALRDVGFEATGGMIGVLGPNGAGKTTLLRQIAGMLEPSRGVVRLGGVDVGRIRRQLARYVGYLPQDFGLPLDMTAREYLDLFARLYGVGDPEARRKRVERLLREVGLEDRADERLGRYSGGMRQRAAVARTLLRLPPVIVVDEPTVGLDPRERIRFRNLLARLAEGRIVLFSTHVVEDVAVACERVLVLAAGRLVFDGAPEELSRVATGRVYEVDLPPERAGEELPGRVVDRLPLPGGGTRVRLLAAGPPPGLPARPVPATLQDGYLLLVTRAAEGEAA